MDARHVSLLALCDVTSAFDSVDHSSLIQRLPTSLGLTDRPLKWIRFFLSERTNCVTFGSSRSASVHVPLGVPQVSVLGPLMYVIYMHIVYRRYREAVRFTWLTSTAACR